MNVTVLLFASLKDLLGEASIAVDVEPDLTVAEFLSSIESSHPPLQGRLTAVRVAVDHEFRAPSDTIPPGSEVALIPPVSGG